MAMDEKKDKKLNYEDFYKAAILRLRDTSKSKGIHSVFSGFNGAFREYFGEDPVKVTQELNSQGKIEVRPAKRGVMIYLPGEAPTSKSALGKTALLKILGEPPEHIKGLVDSLIDQFILEGVVKTFPDDFFEKDLGEIEFKEIVLPGTILHPDLNSPNIITSPKGHFRYETKNPSEAKYITYAYKIGQKSIRVPIDFQTVFKAVTNYEKYCRELKEQAFARFLENTHDEEMAELNTKEVVQRLDLRA